MFARKNDDLISRYSGNNSMAVPEQLTYTASVTCKMPVECV